MNNLNDLLNVQTVLQFRQHVYVLSYFYTYTNNEYFYYIHKYVINLLDRALPASVLPVAVILGAFFSTNEYA